MRFGHHLPRTFLGIRMSMRHMLFDTDAGVSSGQFLFYHPEPSMCALKNWPWFRERRSRPHRPPGLAHHRHLCCGGTFGCF